ncbi:MAG: hypothetical protein QOH99_1801 [Frankiaceae bacterium]|nr:hypothetical protein [Frankiaceae bacterium]
MRGFFSMNVLVRTTTVLAALTLGLAGCTSAPASPTTAGSSSTSPSDTSSSSGSPTGASTGTTSASPSVPPFVDGAGKKFPTLQESGGAVVTVNGVQAKVFVHPDSVTKGTVADLGAGAKVPKGQLPFFVTVTYTNAGTTTLQFPSLGTYLRATGTNAEQPTPFTSDNPIPKCVSKDSPETFKPGAIFTDCQVLLFPTGTTIGQLAYRPGAAATEMTWKVA